MESQEFKTDFEKLKFLLNLVREANRSFHKVLIVQKLQEVAAYAHFFEYSFEYWQETGMWRKYSDFPPKTVETKTDKTETVETETDKTETDKMETVETEIKQTNGKSCDFCGEEFFTNKSAQRFCSDKLKNCKNNYHNANK